MKIGIIGAPNAGKDIISNFFVNEKNFKKFAFAGKIKEEFYKISGYTEEQFKASRGKDLEKQIRTELWEYSNKKTNNNKTYFIDPVINETKMYDNVVISDVRTFLELHSIIECNFIPILVLRNFEFELEGEIFDGMKVIPGTQIPLKIAINYKIFWNIYNIDKIYSNLEKLYQYLKEKKMKSTDYHST